MAAKNNLGEAAANDSCLPLKEMYVRILRTQTWRNRPCCSLPGCHMYQNYPTFNYPFGSTLSFLAEALNSTRSSKREQNAQCVCSVTRQLCSKRCIIPLARSRVPISTPISPEKQSTTLLRLLLLQKPQLIIIVVGQGRNALLLYHSRAHCMPL